MASPPYSQQYGTSVSPPYPSHASLPPQSRKRPSDMSAAPPIKRRKPSMMSTTSNLSAHPLRQTSFPPDGNNDVFSPGAISPSISDSMSLVSGSVTGVTTTIGTAKKKRGRKPKNADDNASAVGAAAPTVVSAVSGRGRASRALSGDDEDDIGDSSNIAMAVEDSLKEKQHRAMLVENFDDEQMQRYTVYRQTRLPDAVIRRIINQTLSQSSPPSVVLAVRSVTKVFAGEIIESARKVQAQWDAAKTKEEVAAEAVKLGLPSPTPLDLDDPKVRCRRKGPLTPDHLREALRRYKIERGGGGAGLLGLARAPLANGVERFAVKGGWKEVIEIGDMAGITDAWIEMECMHGIGVDAYLHGIISSFEMCNNS